MILTDEFPLMVCLNLQRREDRRRRASEMFRMHHLRVQRHQSIDGQRFTRSRGWPSVPHRALAASMARIIRHAKRLRTKALLYFEDDVVLDDEFEKRIASVTLPNDWGLLYLGCLHIEPPSWIGTGLVRVKRAYATHAVAIRSSYYPHVLRVLQPSAAKGLRINSAPVDVLLARLHGVIPTYAAYPNLAWQDSISSDLADHSVPHFGARGEQLYMKEVLDGFPSTAFSALDNSCRTPR